MDPQPQSRRTSGLQANGRSRKHGFVYQHALVRVAGDVWAAILKASESAEHSCSLPMCEGLMCSTEVTQPVGATYTCRAFACAMAVRTEWVSVQPGSHEDRGGRERTATRREPAGDAVGAHGTARQTTTLGPEPTNGKGSFQR